MPFINWDEVPVNEVAPGVRIRTPCGEKIMLSLLEMDEDAIVNRHHHPHEQSGFQLDGQMELTIGDETRICKPGDPFIIPPNTPHRAVAVNGPSRSLDIFSPIREDYVELANRYIPDKEY